MLSTNVKRYRKKLGLTQEKLASRLKITYSTLAKIEVGAMKNPTFKTLKQIAHALGITIDTLVK